MNYRMSWKPRRSNLLPSKPSLSSETLNAGPEEQLPVRATGGGSEL